MAKLTNQTRTELLTDIINGVSDNEIAEKYEVTARQIRYYKRNYKTLINKMKSKSQEIKQTEQEPTQEKTPTQETQETQETQSSYENTYICANCEAELKENQQYCAGCGMELQWQND